MFLRVVVQESLLLLLVVVGGEAGVPFFVCFILTVDQAGILGSGVGWGG